MPTEIMTLCSALLPRRQLLGLRKAEDPAVQGLWMPTEVVPLCSALLPQRQLLGLRRADDPAVQGLWMPTGVMTLCSALLPRRQLLGLRDKVKTARSGYLCAVRTCACISPGLFSLPGQGIQARRASHIDLMCEPYKGFNCTPQLGQLARLRQAGARAVRNRPLRELAAVLQPVRVGWVGAERVHNEAPPLRAAAVPHSQFLMCFARNPAQPAGINEVGAQHIYADVPTHLATPVPHSSCRACAASHSLFFLTPTCASLQ